jgi:hypothetical protein
VAAELTIACVYRPGGGFTDEYVYRLREGVAKHCHAPHRFVVLTNERFEDFETVRFEQNWPGWWGKLELFRPDLFVGQVAYFDLDTMIVGDITDIVSQPQDFAMLRDMYGKHRVNSAMMVWNADADWSHLYGTFHVGRIAEYSESMEKWGDQGWISDHLADSPVRLQDQFPDRLVSYKVDVKKQGRVPKGASVVVFHGKPRPHQIEWRLPCR